MDKTIDHHDNPKLILKGWKDNRTGKFYLIYVDDRLNEPRITPANEGNKIFKKRGFHPTVVDSKIIQPFETAFSKVLPGLGGVEPNSIVRIRGNERAIMNFSVRQLIGGIEFKDVAREHYDSFPDLVWKRLASNYPDVPDDDLLIEYYRRLPDYVKQLKYENTMFQKYDENVGKLSSMECWGIRIDPSIGEFITGSKPWFSELEGDDFEQLNCVRRIYLTISPNFYIVFNDVGWRLREGQTTPFTNEEALEMIRYFNFKIMERSDYVISRSIPFIGCEYFPRLKTEIDEYLLDHPAG